MKLLLILTGLFCLDLSTYAQVTQLQMKDTFSFNSYYGGIISNKIDQDGNVINLYTGNGGGYEVFTLTKTTKRGDTIWNKFLVTTPETVDIVDSEHYIISNGYFPGFGLTSVDTDAVRFWYSSFTPYSLNVKARGLSIINKNELMISGSCGLNSSNSQIDGILFKVGYKVNGSPITTIWKKRYFPSIYNWSVYFDQIACTNNAVYVTGQVAGNPNDIIFKIDTGGNFLNSYRLDSVITVDTVKMKYRYFQDVKCIKGRLFLSCRFVDTNLRTKHESLFVGEYDTTANTLTGKMYSWDSVKTYDPAIVHFVDTNIYYVALRPAEYGSVIVKVMNDSIVYCKYFKAPSGLLFNTIDYADDTVVIGGSYFSSAYYACFDDSIMTKYTLQSDDTGTCTITDTILHSKDFVFKLKQDIQLQAADAGNIHTQDFYRKIPNLMVVSPICIKDSTTDDTTTNTNLLKKVEDSFVNVYPNPSSGKFYIDYNGTDVIKHIWVINNLGQKLDAVIHRGSDTQFEVEILSQVHTLVYCVIMTDEQKFFRMLRIE